MCRSEGHKHGGHKVTETFVTVFPVALKMKPVKPPPRFFFSLSFLLSQSKIHFPVYFNTIQCNVDIRMRYLMLTSTQHRT